jgi:hypothetical protein
MAILVLVCVAVLVIGITALVTIPVKHVQAVLAGLYWKWSMQVGRSHWEERESPRKPRGEVRNRVNRNAADPGKKPLWAYEERVWEGLRGIHADGDDQLHPHWPDDKIREGEQVKSRSQLYQATFSADGARRYVKRLSRRRWQKLQKDTEYWLGLNTFGGVRTVRPPRPATARPAVAHAQAPATAPPGGNDPTTLSPPSGANTAAATQPPAGRNDSEAG